jgi:hypothetical protein
MLPVTGVLTRPRASCVCSIRHPFGVCLFALTLLACGPHKTTAKPDGAPTASADAAPPPPVPTATASTIPVDARAPDVPLREFVGARSESACKSQTIELAGYQQRGDVALASRTGAFAAAWRVRLGNKPDDQIAMASYDEEGRGLGRPRGVGLTRVDVPPRVFPAGNDWTVVWFDEKGLAYTRVRMGSPAKHDVGHLGAVTADIALKIGLAPSASGAVLAATPFGENRAKLGLFLFSPVDEGVPAVNAFAVTHHTTSPTRAAVATNARGTFAAYTEGNLLVATHFDAMAKEVDTPCTLAPKSDTPREGLGIVATEAGAVVTYSEGSAIRTRALDALGCPASPTWTIAQGHSPGIAPLDNGALLTWVTEQGRFLAVRLRSDGSPATRGLDAAEGSTGVKAPPSVTAFGARAAFGWSETMAPTVSTKRLLVRIVNAGCIP